MKFYTYRDSPLINGQMPEWIVPIKIQEGLPELAIVSKNNNAPGFKYRITVEDQHYKLVYTPHVMLPWLEYLYSIWPEYVQEMHWSTEPLKIVAIHKRISNGWASMPTKFKFKEF